MADMIFDARRVLVFSAHAADFCSRAGGTIARLVEAGAAVQVCDMTYGERCESPALWTRDPAPSLQEVKAIRSQEIAAAASVLGASIDCLDWGDSPLRVDPGRQEQLLDLLRAFRPDLVLTHWIEDILHPDHVECSRAAVWASRYCFRPGLQTTNPPCPAPRVVFYETTLGTAPVARFLPTLFVDIGATLARKRQALDELRAQPGLADRYETLARYRALEAQSTAWMQGCEAAEGFIRLGTESGGWSGTLSFGA